MKYITHNLNRSSWVPCHYPQFTENKGSKEKGKLCTIMELEIAGTKMWTCPGWLKVLGFPICGIALLGTSKHHKDFCSEIKLLTETTCIGLNLLCTNITCLTAASALVRVLLLGTCLKSRIMITSEMGISNTWKFCVYRADGYLG